MGMKTEMTIRSRAPDAPTPSAEAVVFWAELDAFRERGAPVIDRPYTRSKHMLEEIAPYLADAK